MSRFIPARVIDCPLHINYKLFPLLKSNESATWKIKHKHKLAILDNFSLQVFWPLNLLVNFVNPVHFTVSVGSTPSSGTPVTSGTSSRETGPLKMLVFLAKSLGGGFVYEDAVFSFERIVSY
jgi:hypothetical protein